MMKKIKIIGIILHLIIMILFTMIFIEEKNQETLIAFSIVSLICLAPLTMFIRQFYTNRVSENDQFNNNILDNELGGLSAEQQEINLSLSRFSPIKFWAILSGIIQFGFGSFFLIKIFANLASIRSKEDILLIIGIIGVPIISGILIFYYLIKITYPIIREGTN